MHKRFLLFACLVFLASVIYFIYTTLSQQIFTGELQQTIQKSNGNVAKHVPRVSPSKFKRVQLTSGEEKVFEQPFQESYKGAENEKLTFAAEMGTDDTIANSEINSEELETLFLFVVVNEWRDKNIAHGEQTAPFMRDYAALSHIEQDLIRVIDGTSGEETQRLYEELERVQSGKEDISKMLAPFDREMERANQELEQYLETNHGLTIAAFFDTYRKDFDTWRELQ